jgi:hypothetical protein
MTLYNLSTGICIFQKYVITRNETKVFFQLTIFIFPMALAEVICFQAFPFLQATME